MLRGGRTSQVPDELEAILIMREFGWTYEEYLKQPLEIIEGFKVVKSLENKYQENESKSNKTL